MIDLDVIPDVADYLPVKTKSSYEEWLQSTLTKIGEMIEADGDRIRSGDSVGFSPAGWTKGSNMRIFYDRYYTCIIAALQYKGWKVRTGNMIDGSYCLEISAL